MNKLLFPIAAIFLLAACNNSEEKHAATTDTQTVSVSMGDAYQTDSSSILTWTGSKPTGTHTGTFKLKEGVLNITEGKLTGGSFTIDINSLTNVDLASDAENKGKIEGHLKSPDFFDVAKFPVARFEITSVKPFAAVTDSSAAKAIEGATNIISGNLTLKDSTKNLSFPARVTIGNGTAAASAEFSIDRTLWGMNYKGPNNPQDWFISKTVDIKLNISAAKK